MTDSRRSQSKPSCIIASGQCLRYVMAAVLLSSAIQLQLSVAPVDAAPRFRTCRRLFRERPGCCLLTTDPESMDNCVSERRNAEQCLCHPACTGLGNCCPDFENICPQPGNLLQAWCPSQYLEEMFLNDVATLPDVHGSETRRSGKKSIWEKRIARNRFPWHRLHYSIRTDGYKPVETPALHPNDPEGLPDANRPNFTDNGFSLSTLIRRRTQVRNLEFEVGNSWARVQGRDRREWPWSALGRIVYNHYQPFVDDPVESTCTGTLIGPRHVLTAAHCLFDRTTRRWHEQISFFPTLTNSTNSMEQEPIGWQRITVPYAYKVQGLKEYDYGLIVLREEVDNWLAFGAQSPGTKKLQLVGFDRYSLWRNDNCTFTVAQEHPQGGTNKRHFPITGHNCSARPGMSGAPLLNAEREVLPRGNQLDHFKSSDRVIYAIHTHGTAAPQSSAHHGGRALKINLCIFHTLCGWLNYQDNTVLGFSPLDNAFRRSLGTSCRNMHNFIPSLIRHSGTHTSSNIQSSIF